MGQKMQNSIHINPHTKTEEKLVAKTQFAKTEGKIVENHSRLTNEY
jgi:hypothetical protein